MERYTRRSICECGTVKVAGRCPTCEPLRQPALRRSDRRRRRIAPPRGGAFEMGQWLTPAEVAEGASRARENCRRRA